MRSLAIAGCLLVGACLAATESRGAVVIAEGERFKPAGPNGWQVVPQDQSYASHTYGGMWVSQGGLLGAKSDAVDAVASQTVQIPEAGQYRVWSKYQAPPYFNYLHKIEVLQGGKVVFTHTYGAKGTERLWSFSGESNELWWPWGVDHDAAESPANAATLQAGAAEIRLTAVKNADPAGDRFVDFVVLTTNQENGYQGFKPYAVGSPFCNEAIAATKLYLRFKNDTAAAAQATLRRAGHFQPQYGGGQTKIPEQPVAPGQWSAWTDIGPFCRLVHDEGVWIEVPGAGTIAVQVARDAAGKDLVGDVKLTNKEAISIPVDATWNPAAKVEASRTHAERLIAASRTWRKSTTGKKPQEILYFGAFNAPEPWVPQLKDALGYNTGLPPGFAQSKWRGYHNHVMGEKPIADFAAKEPDKATLRFISFGDEISLGQINFKDPANLAKFRAWLQAKGIGPQQLGVPAAQAELTATGDPRLVWYSNLFNEEERFAVYRASTEAARREIGPHVLTGANYSPHHLALCYGPIFQWVDVFKHGGMSMFWGEDYIFSVPEAPQILSWMFAQIRCGTKYKGQPIHFYVMPHAPGQPASYLRRNMLASVGYGARHIDSFWVAPEENFTENYVSWRYPDTFKTIHDAIHETADAEHLAVGGTVRAGRVAIVTGKATDFNESRLMVPKAADPLAGPCRNAPATLNQIVCRKDQQMLYLALRHAQQAVDLITEDDVVERDELKKYDVVYFAGEWIDDRIVPKLEAWVQAGGVLYAAAGCGHLNQFGRPEPAMAKLLGHKSSTLDKNAIVIRTLLELPLLPAIDTITLDGQEIAAVGMKQRFVVADAKVLGTWKDGSAAVTVRELGKGKAFAVGTLAGNTYMKTAVKKQPWPRGGLKQVYNPVDFAPAATKLARLGIDAKPVASPATCSNPFVEATVVDHPQGTLVTLVNWNDQPVTGVTVSVRLPQAPKEAKSVSARKTLASKYADGQVTFTTDLAEADYVLLPK